MPTRVDLQKLSKARLAALKDLLKTGHYDIVCQDSGYVIEYTLKAAVCNRNNAVAYPDHIPEYRSHKFKDLIKFAKLEEELVDKKSDINFFTNWSLLSKWSVHFRYQPIGTNNEEKASDYLDAIDNQKDGVYTWLKNHW